ncbi:MAG TPA: hypothetical protein VG126_12865 [Thermoleophilaceae bacterium]|nr:hypothetical protein [Thermoleophilaceae bacterium]
MRLPGCPSGTPLRKCLFRVSDAAELAEALAAAVIANHSAAHRALRRARSAGRAALTAAQASAVIRMIGELGEGVELALTPGLAARDPDRALDLALELSERVATADCRRLILFFDEIQEVASARRPYGDPDAVTNRMRAVFQRATSVSYLFAGRSPNPCAAGRAGCFGPRARRARTIRACLQRLRQLLCAAADLRGGTRRAGAGA